MSQSCVPVADAKKCLRQLTGRLAAIVFDNKLISGEPVAATFYAYARSRASTIPFIVYSAFPPRELPKDDPFLAVITKPFMDEVFRQLSLFASMTGKTRAPLALRADREAA